MKSTGTALVVLMLCSMPAWGQEVLPLYPGSAPGSEDWAHEEKQYHSPIFNTEVVTNVVQPTLISYLPDEGKATGISVIVCPGGGFHALSIHSEGTDVAKWLNERGVAAFVLKYRLVPTGEDGVRDLIAKMGDPTKAEKDFAMIRPLAIADGQAAVRYVRTNAAELGVDPDRIGLMGFSAGGAVAAGVVFADDASSRPDFVAPIYAGADSFDMVVPDDAPPIFLVAATDDQLGLAPESVKLYSAWVAAGKSAELHLYAKGGHGFGMRTQNLPSDRWIELFGDWLEVWAAERLNATE